MAQDDRHGHELQTLSSTNDSQGPSTRNKVGATSTRPISMSSSITVREHATTTTHTLWWPIVVFLIYTAFALFSWISLCIMSARPIRKEKSYNAEKTETYEPRYWYDVNAKYFRTAQILQSITAIITIPVTTAICSMACVAYMQAGSLRKSLTLRQSMALADRGWMSPGILNSYTHSGSLPLLCALALTLIGSISQILQSAFVEHESILARGYKSASGTGIYVNDIPNLVGGQVSDFSDRSNEGNRMMKLRNLLESPYSSDDDAKNWGNPYKDAGYSIHDDENALTHGNIYSPLPSSFSRNAFPIAQYAPRMNSSVVYVNITENEFKENCRNETDNGGFYAKYGVDAESLRFKFEACMPTDLRNTPWKVTRDRQDITEKLYLGLGLYGASEASLDMVYWKLEAGTSLGYFELPSEQNNNTPGQLRDKDPLLPRSAQIKEDMYRRAENVSYFGNDTLSQETNMGPLASVALALFGRYSFVESRMSDPSRFILPYDRLEDGIYPTGTKDCVYKFPMGNWGNYVSQGCVRHWESLDERDVYTQVRTYLEPFYSDATFKYELRTNLNHAIYMANKLWLGGTYPRGSHPQLAVAFDAGIPLIKPKISLAGRMVGSIFLAAHLLGLLLLAIYVFMMKPWSDTMGAEVMLKMGMVYSDTLAQSQTKKEWKETLNNLPGYIGDEKPNEQVGRLGLGAAAGLSRRKGRQFEVLK